MMFGTSPYLFDKVTYSTTLPDPWPNSPQYTESVAWDYSWLERRERGPQYGWYQEFQLWPRLAERVRCVAKPSRLRRPQSRRCHVDARRWKRRRFLHALRSSA